MEKWKTHVISFLTVAIFLAVAMSSVAEYDELEIDCNDPILNESVPTAATNKTVSFDLLVLDDLGQPVVGQNLNIQWFISECKPICPDKCVHTLLERIHNVGVTNSAGKYDSPTIPWSSTNENDVVNTYISIEAESSEYETKKVSIRFGNGETTKSKTVVLLKKDSL